MLGLLPKLVPPVNTDKMYKDEFLMKTNTSGAFRQLSNNRSKGRKRKTALPGGKLLPLFHNYSTQAQSNGSSEQLLSASKALPNISPVLLKQLMSGNIEDLPPRPSETVRIYLASVNSDMVAERNILKTKAVRELQEFCREYYLGFQLVDLQWGVVPGDDSDCNFAELRRQEIEECQRLSLGPHFVALVGDSYGSPEMVHQLTQDEFHMLYELAIEVQHQHAELLPKYFSIDSKNIFVIKKWPRDGSELNHLKCLLQELLSMMKNDARMSLERLAQLSASALETDIHHGLLKSSNPHSHCLCYQREFQGVPSSSGNSVDTARILHLATLGRQHLGPDNYRTYYLPWETSNPTSSEYNEYLESFCSDFISDVKRLISSGLTNSMISRNSHLAQEVIHHSFLWTRRLSYLYCEQPELFTRLECFTRNVTTSHQVFVIHGPSGSGKSAVMAAAGCNIWRWFAGDCVVVMRFIGTSSDSSYIDDVIESITAQICATYGIHTNRQASTLYDILAAFSTAVKTVSEKHGIARPLFILLDGIHRLSGSHRDWLRCIAAITQLPPNVFAIISTVPSVGNIQFLDWWCRLLACHGADYDACVAEVSTLSDSKLNSKMCAKEPPPDAVLHVCERSQQMLHLWLLMQTTDDVMADTIAACVTSKLSSLEDTCGEELVRMYTCYLCVSSIGLQEAEICQLVPDDTPPLLLAKLRTELAPWMEERLEYGRYVLAWSHVYIRDIIAAHYGIICAGTTADHLTPTATDRSLQLHKDLARLFERRGVASLGRLPLHLLALVPTEGAVRIKEQVLFNLSILLAQLQRSPRHLINIVAKTLQLLRRLHDEGISTMLSDVQHLHTLLLQANAALLLNTDHFCCEIIGRFSHDIPSYLRQLRSDAVSWLAERPSLIPVFPCLIEHDGPLWYLRGPTHGLDSLHEGQVIVTFGQHAGVQLWENSELLLQLPVHNEQPMAHIIVPINDADFIIIGQYSHVHCQMAVRIISTETGVEMSRLIFPHRLDALALSHSGNSFAIGTAITDDQHPFITRCCLLVVDINNRDNVEMLTAPDDQLHSGFGVARVSFTDDDLRVVTTGRRDVAVWRIDESRLEFTFQLDCIISDLVVCHQMAVCGCRDDGVIVIIDLCSGDLMRHDVIESKDMGKMYVTKVGKHVVLASQQHGAVVFSLITNNITKHIGSECVTFTFDSDEFLLFLAQQNGDIHVHVTATGQQVAALSSCHGHINTLDYLEGDRLLSAGDDHCACIWSLTDRLSHVHIESDSWDGVVQFEKPCFPGTLLPAANMSELPTDVDDISCIVVVPDQHLLITASWSGPIKVWQITTGLLVRVIEQGCENGVSSIYLACHDKLLIGHCIGKDATLHLQIWQLNTGSLINLTDNPKSIFCSCHLPSGEDIIVISPSMQQPGLLVSIYSLFDLKISRSIHCDIQGKMNTRNLHLLHDRTAMYNSRSQEGAPHHHVILAHIAAPMTSHFYTFSVAISDQAISMHKQQPMRMKSKSPSCSVFFKSKYCVTGTTDGKLTVWDITMQNVCTQMSDSRCTDNKAHRGAVSCVTANDDCSVLISGGDDGKVKMWDLGVYTLLAVFSGHCEMVTCLHMSADKTILLSASTDNTIMCWKTSQTKKLCSFYAHAPIGSIFMTKCKNYVAALLNKGNQRLILLKTEQIA